jgi:phospholipid/cholesterol/gamma-HCH transport system substrate-binding protein
MKKDTGNKIKLGMFVSLGIVILIMGIYFIGEKQQLFRNTFHLSGVFKDVSGLQAGNNVRFSGINVGTVKSIVIISDSTVKVDLLIDDKTRKFIKKDAVASIGSEGLMGNKILIITPGSGGKSIMEDNDVIATTPPLNMDDVIKSLNATINNASDITNDLSKITNNIQAGNGTIGKLLMDQKLADSFDSTFINLEQGSAGLRNLVTNAKNSFAENFDSTFVNLKDASVGFKLLMDKAQKSWLLWGF